MSKRVKEMLVTDIRQRIGETRDLLLIDSSKIDANTANKFRMALRQKEISALTVQNTLARKALNDAGITTLDALLQGPSTLVWGGDDIVALSKEIMKWAKDVQELEVKGGTLEGESLGPADVDSLSNSPSRQELIGQIAGALLSPAANLAAALLAPGAQLANQVEQISEKEEETASGEEAAIGEETASGEETAES